ncbi:hypothetical protein ATANTOWER_027694 [Ataeniobius toweri]|uniref:Uncharacterized protein n=1 Tax=Ataeniobius toweri TaxID=208326 RepID=A0ABU7AJI3_9TELE|nr:hypothetical protein [Ataeniobius toweri]
MSSQSSVSGSSVVSSWINAAYATVTDCVTILFIMHLQHGIIHIDRVHRMIRNAAMASKKILTQCIHPPWSIQSSQEELGVGWSCVKTFRKLRRLLNAPVIFEECILSGI